MSGELLVIQIEGLAGANPKKVRLKIMSCKLAELQEKCQLFFQG
jgi:hypothetical protein